MGVAPLLTDPRYQALFFIAVSFEEIMGFLKFKFYIKNVLVVATDLFNVDFPAHQLY